MGSGLPQWTALAEPAKGGFAKEVEAGREAAGAVRRPSRLLNRTRAENKKVLDTLFEVFKLHLPSRTKGKALKSIGRSSRGRVDSGPKVTAFGYESVLPRFERDSLFEGRAAYGAVASDL